MPRISTLAIIAAFTITAPCFAMIFDNRFFPFFQRPIARDEFRKSHMGTDFFITTAGNSFDRVDSAKEIGLYEIYGAYNQVDLTNAAVAIGLPNFLPSELRAASKLPWRVDGKIQSQGLALDYHQHIWGPFSTGFSWVFMRALSSQKFSFLRGEASQLLLDSDIIALDESRRALHAALGLIDNQSTQVGFGDLEYHVRIGHVWNYLLKFRRIDAGLKLGLLIPTGVQHELSMPSSVPFGGSGHFGMYWSLEAEFELKEDWKLGLLFHMNKRFAKTQLGRMPVFDEPEIFGAIVGDQRRVPGLTVVFSPYAALENLREGLGVRVQYTLINHSQEGLCDARSCTTAAAKLDQSREISSWAEDFVTVTAFYEFGTARPDRTLVPRVSFAWDIPAMLLLCKGAVKTNKISLGLSFDF